nr:MAG TPA: protein of unknown function (DUF5320) [Caudoviricetes sp.]
MHNDSITEIKNQIQTLQEGINELNKQMKKSRKNLKESSSL